MLGHEKNHHVLSIAHIGQHSEQIPTPNLEWKVRYGQVLKNLCFTYLRSQTTQTMISEMIKRLIS